jgi:hypothetical protein
MKTVVLALIAAVACASAAVGAQPNQPTIDHPSARNLLDEQLSEVSARIGHRLADGRLTQRQAHEAQLVINDIQSEAADKRLQDGGQLTEQDRFGLQERIRQLIDQIDRESGAPRPAAPR